MSELDTLPEQFERLLDGIRGKFTLAEWRYAYRKVIYSGARKILDDFPEIVIGPPPPPPQSGKGPGPAPGGNPAGQQPGAHPVGIAGQPPPYHPSAIHEYLCIVLGDCQQQT